MSPVSVAIWSQDLEPNKRNVYTVENDIRISGASLPVQLKDKSERTVVEVVIKIPEDYDIDDIPTDEKTGEQVPMHKFVLCALTPGKIEQLPLDLVLPEGEEIEFVVTGKNPIHLYGNYIAQNGTGGDSDSESDEDEYDLEDVPSDVEVGLGELEDLEGDSGRFEEIETAPPKSGKRAREEDDAADVSMASGADVPVLSKKEKKRAKKLKNEAGKAAPAPTETTTTTIAATTTTVTPANSKDAKPAEKDAEKKEGKKEGKKDGEKKKKDLASNEPKTLPGGVIIVDKTVGTGPAAKAGKKIGMRYIGRLKSGKVFDSNTKGKPFFFTLGAGDVIKGWDEGIIGMNVGGERVLTIPAAKGYGKRGAPPDIPPNAELIFEVKLVEVK
ncbi:peptidylprolyl isomerase fpr4 [Ceratobasidium sp. 392]|nr:peptidylprolyl isomerase fpr4 [Ceratobasidium sp. 392]